MAPSKKSKKHAASETLEKDQDDLMSTLESIRGLLEQSEGKLNAARESISIANTNTQNDTSALMHIRNSDADDEIVPILDDIVEPESTSSDSHINIPELDAVFMPEETEPDTVLGSDVAPALETDESHAIEVDEVSIESEDQEKDNNSTKAADLSSLTQKNLLIDALDDMQLELEQSLRETLMKTMVSLEKELKDRVSQRIEQIKSDILD